MILPAPQQRPFVLRVPGLQSQIGAGDVIAAITKAVGMKLCTPCEQRQEALNKLVQFLPKGTNVR